MYISWYINLRYYVIISIWKFVGENRVLVFLDGFFIIKCLFCWNLENTFIVNYKMWFFFCVRFFYVRGVCIYLGDFIFYNRVEFNFNGIWEVMFGFL